MRNWRRWCAVTVGLLTASTAVSCGDSDSATSNSEPEVAGVSVTRAAGPTEYVGLIGRVELDPRSPETVLAPLFGIDTPDAHTLDLGDGLRLVSSPHPDTSGERVLTVTMDVDAEPAERTLAASPVSTAKGSVFVEAARVSLARNLEVEAEGQEVIEPVRLEFRSTSSNGGSVTLVVDDQPGAPPVLDVKAETPVTSLSKDNMNGPATDGGATESIYGLVWFTLDRDEFDFFVNRAYGISAGKSQNFKDFELGQHDWLRLTVTPQLDDERVDVGFEVVTLDGERVPFAKAPASLIAGEQFMRTVFRMLDVMEAQEAREPGSSTPWEAPFYYDDPDGGGVVEVIAKGEKGVFRIAYSVESPRTEVHDVEFNAYQGSVEVPDDWDAPSPTCEALDASESPSGRFSVTFKPSSTVLGSELKAPLKGHVYGQVFRDADVGSLGPRDGAEGVAELDFADVDVTGGESAELQIDEQLQSGLYQILGFMDIDNNADPNNPEPDAGDPVFIPIGGYQLECDTQPVTVEFALVLPEQRAG